MKKNFINRKGLLLTLIVTSAMFVLAGCADKKAVDRMFDTAVDSASFNAALDMQVDVVGKDSANNLSITNEYDLEGAVDGISTNEANAYITGSSSMNYADVEVIDGSINKYYETRETDSILYDLDLDSDDPEWTYESLNDGDIEYRLNADAFDITKTASRDIWYKANKKFGKTTIDGEKCYALELKPKKEELMTLMQAVVDGFYVYYTWEDVLDEIEGYTGLPAEDFLDCCKFTITAYTSVENGYFMGLDIKCTKFDMNKYMKLQEYTYEDYSFDYDFDVKKIALKNATFSLRFSSVNNTSVVIPKEVSDCYDMWNEDDWDDIDWDDLDVDIDDIDWEDEEFDWDEDDWDEDIFMDEDDEEGADDDWDDEEDVEDDEFEDDERSSLREVDLLDESGNKLLTISVPTIFGYYPDYSEESAIDLMDSTWMIDCIVSSTIDQGYASVEFDDFMYCESDPDEEYVDDTVFTKEAITIGKMGGTAYYVEGKGGPDGDEAYIIVPYTDVEGDPAYVTVSFSDGKVDGWSKDDYINMAHEMFG